MTKVMFIDDNEMNNALTKAIIEIDNIPIHPIVYKSPLKALEALKKIDNVEDIPDKILVDIQMPELTGFEFVERFEKMYPKAETAVFFLSASMIEENRIRGMSYNCVKGFYEKPFSLEIAQEILEFGGNGN